MSSVWDLRDRFPLQPPGGVELPREEPSGIRPFGMRYAVVPKKASPAEMGKHDKPTGTKPVTKPTEYTNDGKKIPDETTYTVRD